MVLPLSLHFLCNTAKSVLVFLLPLLPSTSLVVQAEKRNLVLNFVNPVVPLPAAHAYPVVCEWSCYNRLQLCYCLPYSVY